MITKSLLSAAAFLMAMLALGIQIAGWRRDRRRQRAISRAVSRIGAPTNRDMLQDVDLSWLRKTFFCPPHHGMLDEKCVCHFDCTCRECWRAWLDEEARP